MKPIIKSLLDLDRYLLTMCQFIFFHYPDVEVEFGFTNRTKNEKADAILISLIPYIKEELKSVKNLRFSFSELLYLQSQTIYRPEFLNFLTTLDLGNITPTKDENGRLAISYRGKWSHNVLWETIVLSIISELYSRAVAFMKYNEEQSLTQDEFTKLLPDVLNGNNEELIELIFKPYKEEYIKRLDEKIDIYSRYPTFKSFEFGTRRRFSSKFQEIGILRLSERFHKPQFIGSSPFLGTSNEYMGMKHNIKVGGTFAHEMDMIIAGLHDNDEEKLVNSMFEFRRQWYRFYGYDLCVGLTDTFGSDFYFKNCPEDVANWFSPREDSAVDLFKYTDDTLKMYRKYDINTHEKIIVHSNSIIPAKAINILGYCSNDINKAFGIGTDYSADVGLDFLHLSIVIKASKVFLDGRWIELVKLSDNLSKAIGAPKQVERYKKLFGYVNQKSEVQIY